MTIIDIDAIDKQRADKHRLPDKGVVIAFDFGLARIGIATGNIESKTATPRMTIKAAAGEPDWASVDRLLAEWQPIALVVGCPAPDSGKRLMAMLERFVYILRDRNTIPVILYNEEMSSASARAALRERRQSGFSRKTSKSDVDKVAAAIILEDFLGSVDPNTPDQICR